jgi:hypothetical protein
MFAFGMEKVRNPTTPSLRSRSPFLGGRDVVLWVLSFFKTASLQHIALLAGKAMMPA